MPLNDVQIGKINAALQPLFADPDFAGVTDLDVKVSITPVAPQPEVDDVDVKPALPA